MSGTVLDDEFEDNGNVDPELLASLKIRAIKARNMGFSRVPTSGHISQLSLKNALKLQRYGKLDLPNGSTLVMNLQENMLLIYNPSLRTNEPEESFRIPISSFGRIPVKGDFLLYADINYSVLSVEHCPDKTKYKARVSVERLHYMA